MRLFGNLHRGAPLRKIGVDHLTAKGYIDSARLSIAGGLLAAWATGNTGRFHAAVVRHAIADWVTDVATRPTASTAPPRGWARCPGTTPINK